MSYVHGDPHSSGGSWERLSQVAIKGAEYDSRERQPHPKCLEGTRVHLLNHIHGILDGKEKSQLIWLHGTAGVGKSAVAFTVAETMRSLKVTEQTNIETRLAGTFFFSRKHTERCTTGFFFATLAYQLACNFPSVREDLSRVIRENPALLDHNKSLRDQMEGLFLGPLRRLQLRLRECPPSTFVIDALDECMSEAEVADLISLLGRALRDPDLPIIHILLTSRSEAHIREAIQEEGVRSLVCEIPVKISGQGVAMIISLDGVDVDSDIYIFLEHSFRKLQSRCSNFPKPTSHELARLASRAGRRFIVASTMMKFIDDGYHDPRDRLQLMLEFTSELLPGTEVYKLYDLILATCADPNRAYLHLSVIATLADPLPISQISELLGPGEGKDVEGVLVQLRSVIDIPTDITLTVNICHSSLREYVSDPSNSSLPQVQHVTRPQSLLAHSCFRLMLQAIPNTTFPDALSELKRRSHSMNPHKPQSLKTSLAFIVQPPEPLQALIGLLWLQGNRSSGVQSWLETLDGHAWLQSEEGRDWLPTPQGEDWLQIQGGKDWLQTQGGKDWLQVQTVSGREWLQTSSGSVWLQTQDGRMWLQTRSGKDWLQDPSGREWLQNPSGRDWLRNPSGREWLQTQSGRDWLQGSSGRDWLQNPSGRDWLQLPSGRDWLQTQSGRDWLQTPGGKSWLQNPSGRDWLQNSSGKNWLQTPSGREWLQTSSGRDWLRIPSGERWLWADTGQDWLQIQTEKDGLRLQADEDEMEIQADEDGIEIQDETDWLQTQAGTDWLWWNSSAQYWLQMRGGSTWLQTLNEQVGMQTIWAKRRVLAQTKRERLLMCIEDPITTIRRTWLSAQGWSQIPADDDQLQTDRWQDLLQTQYGRGWLQTLSGRAWLQVPGGQEWLQTDSAQDWLQTPSGQCWLHTQSVGDLLQTSNGREWLRTRSGRGWLHTMRGANWLQTQIGRDWLQTPSGEYWLQTQGGQHWLQSHARWWLQTQSGQRWLQTWVGQRWQMRQVETPKGGEQQEDEARQTPNLDREDGVHSKGAEEQTPSEHTWLQTQRSRGWLTSGQGRLEISSGREWLRTNGGQEWLQTPSGRDWLQTTTGRVWLCTLSGRTWLQTQSSRDWLQTTSGQEWLEISSGREWLRTKGGQEWLQTSSGRKWQSTLAASVWVTMEEFSSTMETISEYTIIPGLLSPSAFQGIQQLRTLPDFLMFPVFLAFRCQDYSTSALPQCHFPSDLEIVHAMKVFVGFARDALQRSRSAPDALKYACQNWAVHLSQARDWDDQLNHIFTVFWNRHLLSWLEMQWCLRGLQSCFVILLEGQKLVQEQLLARGLCQSSV